MHKINTYACIESHKHSHYISALRIIPTARRKGDGVFYKPTRIVKNGKHRLSIIHVYIVVWIQIQIQKQVPKMFTNTYTKTYRQVYRHAYTDTHLQMQIHR